MNKIFYVLENNSGDVVQLYKNDDENVIRAYEKVGVFKFHVQLCGAVG